MMLREEKPERDQEPSDRNRAGPDSVEKEGGETAGVRDWEQSLVLTVEARWFKNSTKDNSYKKTKV